MDGSKGRVKGDRKRRGSRVEEIDVIPQDVSTLRYMSASRRTAARFADLEYGRSDRAWALARPRKARRWRGRASRALLRAALAYFSPRYAFHGSQ